MNSFISMSFVAVDYFLLNTSWASCLAISKILKTQRVQLFEMQKFLNRFTDWWHMWWWWYQQASCLHCLSCNVHFLTTNTWPMFAISDNFLFWHLELIISSSLGSWLDSLDTEGVWDSQILKAMINQLIIQNNSRELGWFFTV